MRSRSSAPSDRSEGQLAPSVEISLVRLSECIVAGSAFDPRDPDRRFTVEFLLDGVWVGAARADHVELDPPLGDGSHGFIKTFRPGFLQEHDRLEVLVANVNGAVGKALHLADSAGRIAPPELPGVVYQDGQGLLRGWIDRSGEETRVVVSMKGQVVATARPDRWVNVGEEREGPKARASFAIYLEDGWMGDGSTQLHVHDQDGIELDGSPLTPAPLSDPLLQHLKARADQASEVARIAHYALWFPRTMPFAAYEDWRQGFAPPIPATPTRRSLGIVLTGSGDVASSMDVLRPALGDTVSAVFAATSQHGATHFDPADLLATLSAEDQPPQTLIFAPAGTVFLPGGAERWHALLNEPSVDLAYGDLEFEDACGRHPILLPAFDYERLLEQGYCALGFAARCEQVVAALAAVSPSTLFDLFLALLEGREEGVVAHVPFPALRLPRMSAETLTRELGRATRDHFARRAMPAGVAAGRVEPPFPAVKVRRHVAPATPVTLIVPTHDRVDLLSACISSARRCAGDARLRFLIIDNASSEPATLSYLEEARRSGIAVLRDERAFNYARMNNHAVAQAQDGVICLVNNDVEFTDPDTFDEMLSRLAERDVGAVGVLMQHESEVIQHGGVVLGPTFAARHAFCDHVLGDPGYGGLLTVAHQTSAVTAACLMMRRRDFLSAGGFDETAFPVAFNDVDLCLKLAATGKRIVFTPHVALKHHESLSRGSDMAADRRPRFHRELEVLRKRWHRLLRDDPFYNPYLDRTSYPYSGLNCTPHDPAPRLAAFRIDRARAS